MRGHEHVQGEQSVALGQALARGSGQAADAQILAAIDPEQRGLAGAVGALRNREIIDQLRKQLRGAAHAGCEVAACDQALESAHGLGTLGRT